VRRRFATAVARLRRTDALPAAAHGTIRLVYTVTAEGAVTDARVAHASGHAVADSAAVAALQGARHLPAVLGQHYTAISATANLSF
jgi:TonB family protein